MTTQAFDRIVPRALNRLVGIAAAAMFTLTMLASIDHLARHEVAAPDALLAAAAQRVS